MALEFNEQLSRLQKPDRDEMTDEEYAIFNKNVETMEKNMSSQFTSSPNSAPHLLCDPKQVLYCACTSISSSIKCGDSDT